MILKDSRENRHLVFSETAKKYLAENSIINTNSKLVVTKGFIMSIWVKPSFLCLVTAHHHTSQTITRQCQPWLSALRFPSLMGHLSGLSVPEPQTSQRALHS